jgi:YfiH family protein
LNGALPEPFVWRREGELAWIEAALPGGRVAFSTRLGGQSEGPFTSLNLGILTDDDPELVARNRTKLALTLERDPAGVAMGWQVHGTDVQVHTSPPRPSGYVRRGTDLAKVDAQATDDPGVTPMVLTADCVPLALSSSGAVAMVHCGWRGVAGGIVDRAVEACRELADADPGELSAALGPGIGSCCYEVGDEVRSAFGIDAGDGATLDLPLAVRRALEQAGVCAEQISDTGLCTSCHPDLFFSHRRDGGITGRQAGLVWRET